MFSRFGRSRGLLMNDLISAILAFVCCHRSDFPAAILSRMSLRYVTLPASLLSRWRHGHIEAILHFLHRRGNWFACFRGSVMGRTCPGNSLGINSPICAPSSAGNDFRISSNTCAALTSRNNFRINPATYGASSSGKASESDRQPGLHPGGTHVRNDVEIRTVGSRRGIHFVNKISEDINERIGQFVTSGMVSLSLTKKNKLEVVRSGNL